MGFDVKKDFVPPLSSYFSPAYAGRTVVLEHAPGAIRAGEVVGRDGKPLGLACHDAGAFEPLTVMTKGILALKADTQDYIDALTGVPARFLRHQSEAERVEAEMNRDVRDERFMRG